MSQKMILHLDADSFYVAAERLAHPHLQHVPLAVLSSLDAFVIARSYELKPLGIKVGTPKWEAQSIAPNALFIPADFSRYGKVSRQMFQVVRDLAPLVEEYSIDEAFADLSGLDTYYQKSASELCQLIKDRIQQQVGVTVSVGLASTKTLAKLASEYRKPNGLFVVTEQNLHAFLADRAVHEIWGIGDKRGPKLKEKGVETALDFYQLPLETVMRWMGKHGVDLWLELHGHCISPVTETYAPPKSVSRTANFELKSARPEVVFAALSHHTAKVVAILVEDGLFTRHLSIFLRRKDFTFDVASCKLPYPTQNYQVIVAAVRNLFEQCFQRGVVYRGSGIVAAIDPNGAFDLDLFVEYEREQKVANLTQAITQLNRKYGKGTMKYLCTMHHPKPKVRKDEQRLALPIVKAQ
ncbi:MAG: DNA polymerase IV [bacterium]|nr:DNA polymerase IV [bacterium]